MRPTKPPGGKCPNDNPDEGSVRESCPLQCKYNYFESEDLTIHTYELKCLDCGWRDTIGYRSDEDEDEDQDGNGDEPTENPGQCPFCNRCDLKQGKNPCDS